MSKKNRLKKSKARNETELPSPSKPPAGPPLLILGLLGIAFCVAAYLGWTSLGSGSVAGCGPASGCNDVLSSRWSSWLGVPVSLLALPLYLILMVSVLRVGKDKIANCVDVLAFSAVASSVMIGLVAVWFTGIQAFVIGKFCPWCLTAHLAGLMASLLIVKRFWLPRTDADWAGLLTGRFRGYAVMVGGLGVLLLVGGQIAYEPDSFAVETVQNDPKPVESPKETEAETKLTDRLTLHGGRFQLKASEHPLIGKADAGNYMLSLFDYTCHHCRSTHPYLRALMETFPDDLAVISLPTPLNADCNPMMQRLGRKTNAAHRDACQYAALSLAVFRLKPDQWQEFDHWLFTGKEPPGVARAQARAVEVVGEIASLQDAMKNRWISDEVKLAVDIYEANARSKGQGRMPQVVIGNSIVSGSINNPAKLFSVVEEQFKLHKGITE